MRYETRLFFLLHRLFRLQSIVRKKMRPLSRPQRLWKLSSIACSAVLAVQVLAGAAIAQQPDGQPKLAPVTNEDSPNRIPGQYVVVFKPGTDRDVAAATAA